MRILSTIFVFLFIAFLAYQYSHLYALYFIIALIVLIIGTFIFNVFHSRKQSGDITLYYIADRNDLISLGQIKAAKWWRNYAGFLFFPGVYTITTNPETFTKRQLDNYGLNTNVNVFYYELTVPRRMVSVPWVALIFEPGKVLRQKIISLYLTFSSAFPMIRQDCLSIRHQFYMLINNIYL